MKILLLIGPFSAFGAVLVDANDFYKTCRNVRLGRGVYDPRGKEQRYYLEAECDPNDHYTVIALRKCVHKDGQSRKIVPVTRKMALGSDSMKASTSNIVGCGDVYWLEPGSAWLRSKLCDRFNLDDVVTNQDGNLVCQGPQSSRKLVAKPFAAHSDGSGFEYQFEPTV